MIDYSHRAQTTLDAAKTDVNRMEQHVRDLYEENDGLKLLVKNQSDELVALRRRIEELDRMIEDLQDEKSQVEHTMEDIRQSSMVTNILVAGRSVHHASQQVSTVDAALMSALDRCVSSVEMIMGLSDTTPRMANILGSVAARGVPVRVFCDMAALQDCVGPPVNPMKLVTTGRLPPKDERIKVPAMLTKAGVSVMDLPNKKIGNSSLLLVDSVVLFAGNFTSGLCFQLQSSLSSSASASSSLFSPLQSILPSPPSSSSSAVPASTATTTTTTTTAAAAAATTTTSTTTTTNAATTAAAAAAAAALSSSPTKPAPKAKLLSPSPALLSPPVSGLPRSSNSGKHALLEFISRYFAELRVSQLQPNTNNQAAAGRSKTTISFLPKI